MSGSPRPDNPQTDRRRDNRATALGSLHELFEATASPDLIEIARSRTRRVPFTSGEALMREGDTNSRLYLIRSGAVEVVKSSDGGEQHRIATRSAGEHIGEMSIVDGAPVSATVHVPTRRASWRRSSRSICRAPYDWEPRSGASEDWGPRSRAREDGWRPALPSS